MDTLDVRVSALLEELDTKANELFVKAGKASEAGDHDAYANKAQGYQEAKALVRAWLRPDHV